jgi:hypothetical protein
MAVPGGSRVSFVVERTLARRLMERRLHAGTTFAAMVQAGDVDLAYLVMTRIAELRAERQGIDVGLARLAPATTLEPMATRRDPDIIALDQGGVFRLSPRSHRARDWLAANARIGRRDGACVLVTRAHAVKLMGVMMSAGLRVAGVY